MSNLPNLQFLTTFNLEGFGSMLWGLQRMALGINLRARRPEYRFDLTTEVTALMLLDQYPFLSRQTSRDFTLQGMATSATDIF